MTAIGGCALASGALLYGMSMIYGVTGSLQLDAIAFEVQKLGASHVGLNFGLVFLIAGVAFKFGAVPFHMWLPDVYHGAPTPITVYIGSVPKIASFVLAIRLLVEGLGGMTGAWQEMLIVLSVLSMAIGNIVAPKLMGSGLELHPVTVLLALAFWGLLWGIVGMVLAVPIVAMLRIVLSHYQTTKPLANLLAGQLPRAQTPEAAEAAGGRK